MAGPGVQQVAAKSLARTGTNFPDVSGIYDEQRNCCRSSTEWLPVS